MKFTIFDTVTVLNDYPKEGVQRGDFGAIVEIFTQPDEAYEVEFVDERGNAKALIVLHSNEISKLTE